MFARSVSLALVAAIVACPIWCHGGLCRVGSCCSAEPSPHQPSSAHSVTCCCCKGCSELSDGDESLPGGDEPEPFRAPDKSSCQGVCGGAVLEKPVSLHHVSPSFFLPLGEAEALAFGHPTDRHFHGLADPGHGRRGNQGRFMRTLHSSLLC